MTPRNTFFVVALALPLGERRAAAAVAAAPQHAARLASTHHAAPPGSPPPQAIVLRRFGVGHSLGALLHALIASRYPISSAGNALMSYNNRPATGEPLPLLFESGPLLCRPGPLLCECMGAPRTSLQPRPRVAGLSRGVGSCSPVQSGRAA
jgi:hypothetical protein